MEDLDIGRLTYFVVKLRVLQENPRKKWDKAALDKVIKKRVKKLKAELAEMMGP